MLSFDLRALSAKAAQVDGVVAPDDPVWEERDRLPAEPIRVRGRLSSAGKGRYFMNGRMKGVASLECSRCLSDVAVPVEEELQLVFAADEDEEASDPDIWIYDERDGELDLRPAVREAWLLAAPSFALCDEKCRGMCPQCGTDLNSSECGCKRNESDPRWEALRTALNK